VGDSRLRYWAIVPAAGSGMRMGADIPKQYLPLRGKTVIEHTLSRLLACEEISGVVIAVAANDVHWARLRFSAGKPVLEAVGGAERYVSVFNALDVLVAHTSPEDWVLVHDAARPCVRRDDLRRLIARASAHQTGGLLAVPARDTMKRADMRANVLETVERRDLWHALTPQMFRLGELHAVMGGIVERGLHMTDESSAMEFAGHHPLLVEGHPDNIKITHPQDLQLAELLLAYLEQENL
jgi:2-C-methyl-D-erythritol 4-phosphate cytidylyltransferase